MKTELVWKKEYEVGDYEIDSEHQIFVKIIIKIKKAYQDDVGIEYQTLLMRELYKYADFHFASEENRMILFKYPYYETHKQEHKKLLSELSDQIGFYSVKSSNQTKLVDFLLDWFTTHTTSSDLKFGDYLGKLKV